MVATLESGQPPAFVAEKINAYVQARCTTPVLRFASMDQHPRIERFVNEVVPLLKGVITADAGATARS